MRTEIGKIQADVQSAKEDEEKTPLGQKIDAFGELLAKVICYICVAVWVMNYNQFSDPVHGGFWKGLIYYLKIAVALGVAAIPEGLPAVITLCLALGTRKMVQRNAIGKLPSVETLGCTTVICSDKTGTLTTNQMTVVAVAYPSGAGKAGQKGELAEREVTGTSYDPRGDVVGLGSGKKGKAAGGAGPSPDLARACALCNQAVIKYDESSDKFERVGEPTEAALKVLVEKLGAGGCVEADVGAASPSDKARLASAYSDALSEASPLNAILEFSRDRKSMSTLCGYKGGGGSSGRGKSPSARGKSPASARGKSPASARGKSPSGRRRHRAAPPPSRRPPPPPPPRPPPPPTCSTSRAPPRWSCRAAPRCASPTAPPSTWATRSGRPSSSRSPRWRAGRCGASRWPSRRTWGSSPTLRTATRRTRRTRC